MDMLKVTNETILTAGPTITYKEVNNTADAVLTGWNHHMSDYTDKFEKTFAEYIGSKFAFTTSSCTGALHLSMLGMGIGPGDEVIVPETTWIATAAAPVYAGATPVFADIDPETWVLDPAKVERLITKKTKAIIPVQLYGNVVDMDPLNAIAKKYNISVMEDAAPSIGTMYKGKKTGNLGRAGAFSFQGAKALVTGEGGMFVTSDEKLFERTKYIWNQCRDTRPFRTLCTLEIGWKYKMSNVLAALGLAQTERTEEIVEKKRQLFRWYKERLEDIDFISFNVERPNTRNIYWMSCIVLSKKSPVQRNDLIAKLKERNIDSRPFFYPISSFPMFNQDLSKQNPVAYDVPQRGINLPSGFERTEEEVDYICAHIREICDVKSSNKVSMSQPTGWMAYRDMVQDKLKEVKNAKPADIDKYCLPVGNKSGFNGRLRPITASTLENSAEIKLLADWRESVLYWWPEKHKVTAEGTKKWADNALMKMADRVLFFVEDEKKKPVGHVGLYRFNYHEKYCEIDNIIRGDDKAPKGTMFEACKTLLNWAFKDLGIETAYLRVASDNERAIKLYEKLGYKEIQRFPLMHVTDKGVEKWVDVIGSPYQEIKRYYVTMKLPKSIWEKVNA